jgi:REP element-mobilizing transposase RayT
MDDQKFQNKYRIASARLRHYDYSQNGYYFVTICADDRIPYFGEVVHDEMRLSEIGKYAHQCWLDIPEHFPFVVPDEFVIMPNHVHGIVVIDKNIAPAAVDVAGDGNAVGTAIADIVETQYIASLQRQQRRRPDDPPANKFGPQSQNLASIIRGFKAGVTTFARMFHEEFSWQERFYDEIVRNEQALNKIRGYIVDNPFNWHRDRNNQENLWM